MLISIYYSEIMNNIILVGLNEKEEFFFLADKLGYGLVTHQDILRNDLVELEYSLIGFYNE